jgi:hypothetical protein
MAPEITDQFGRLPLTGERTVPGVAKENYWFRRHEVAYLELLGYCADAVVLEAGCGEGWERFRVLPLTTLLSKPTSPSTSTI